MTHPTTLLHSRSPNHTDFQVIHKDGGIVVPFPRRPLTPQEPPPSTPALPAYPTRKAA